MTGSGKGRRLSRSVHSQGALEATLGRLNSTGMGVTKRNKKKLKERYNVEFTGGELPSVMLRKNILRTQSDGVANVMAIQFVRANPVVLFVRGRCGSISYSQSQWLHRFHIRHPCRTAFQEACEAGGQAAI